MRIVTSRKIHGTEIARVCEFHANCVRLSRPIYFWTAENFEHSPVFVGRLLQACHLDDASWPRTMTRREMRARRVETSRTEPDDRKNKKTKNIKKLTIKKQTRRAIAVNLRAVATPKCHEYNNMALIDSLGGRLR